MNFKKGRNWCLLAESIIFFQEADVQRLAEELRAGQWPGGEDELFKEARRPRQEEGQKIQKKLTYEITLAMPPKPPGETVVRVREILRKYPGESRVYLKVLVGEEEKKIATEYQVKPSPVLLEELQGVLGQNAVFYA